MAKWGNVDLGHSHNTPKMAVIRMNDYPMEIEALQGLQATIM